MNRIKSIAALSLILIPGLASAQAGDVVMNVGIVNVNNSRSTSSVQHNVLSSSVATQIGLVPQTFDSPGTKTTIGDSNKPILTLSYFMTDNWAITAVAGIPPKYQLYGQGTVATPGLLNVVVPKVEMGAPGNNPVGSALHWFPNIMAQYFFGERSDTYHPFVGLGIGYSFYTHVRLHQNFEQSLKTTGSVLTLSTTLDPTDSVKADASPQFIPLVSAGVAIPLDKSWLVSLGLTYIPIKTVSTIKIFDKYGNTVMTSKADLDIPAVATSATIGHIF